MDTKIWVNDKLVFGLHYSGGTEIETKLVVGI